MRYLCCLILLAAPGLTWAQCGTTRTRVVEKVVVRRDVIEIVPAAVAVFQAVPVFVPAYGAGYQPGFVPPQQGVQPAAAPAPQGDMALLLTEMRRLNQRLDAIEARQGGATPPGARQGPPPPQGQPTPQAQPGSVPGGVSAGLTLMQVRCAVCHEKTKAATEGGNFVMFDGPLLVIDDRGAVKALRKSRRGEMPPRDNKLQLAPLSDEEYATLADALETRK